MTIDSAGTECSRSRPTAFSLSSGLTCCYTHGNWLWKLEADPALGPGRRLSPPRSAASNTPSPIVFQSSRDVGLLVEYNYDGRRKPPPALFPFNSTNAHKVEVKVPQVGERPDGADPLRRSVRRRPHDGRIEYNNGVPPAFFDNDVFVGTRITFNDENDTNMLVGALIDVDNKGTYLQFEGTRRPHGQLVGRGRWPLLHRHTQVRYAALLRIVGQLRPGAVSSATSRRAGGQASTSLRLSRSGGTRNNSQTSAIAMVMADIIPVWLVMAKPEKRQHAEAGNERHRHHDQWPARPARRYGGSRPLCLGLTYGP